MSLDLETMTLSTFATWRKNKSSDIFCVEYSDESNQSVLYGHRDGTISHIDKRSGTFVFFRNDFSVKKPSSLFGSVTSICKIDPFKVLAKGSFGRLHMHDLRYSSSQQEINSSRSLVCEFEKPKSLQTSPSQQRYNGIAINVRNNSVVSPFKSEGSGKNCHLGLWSLQSGNLMSEIPIVDNISLCASPCISKQRKQCHETTGAGFCELSPIITSGWYLDSQEISNDGNGNEKQNIMIRERKGSWGIWIKTDNSIYKSLNSYPPPNTGGIHHITFP